LTILLQTAEGVVEFISGKEIAVAKQSIQPHLAQLKEDASSLRTIESSKVLQEQNALRDAFVEIQNVVDQLEQSAKDDIRDQITDEAIDKVLPRNVRKDWSYSLGELDKLLLQFLSNHIQKDIDDIQDTLRTKLEGIFKNECELLQRLQKTIDGLEIPDLQANGIVSVMSSVVSAPALAKAASFVLPFLVLALPVIPLWLLGTSIYEEFDEAKKSRERMTFEAHRVKYVQERFDTLLTKIKERFLQLKERLSQDEAPAVIIKGNTAARVMEVAVGSMNIKQQAKEIVKVVDFLQSGKSPLTDDVNGKIRNMSKEMKSHLLTVQLAQVWERCNGTNWSTEYGLLIILFSFH